MERERICAWEAAEIIYNHEIKTTADLFFYPVKRPIFLRKICNCRLKVNTNKLPMKKNVYIRMYFICFPSGWLYGYGHPNKYKIN